VLQPIQLRIDVLEGVEQVSGSGPGGQAAGLVVAVDRGSQSSLVGGFSGGDFGVEPGLRAAGPSGVGLRGGH
jgi:hypothetical protein